MKRILNKYFRVLCIFAVIILIIGRNTDEKIANKPSWIFWSLFIFGGFLSAYITYISCKDILKEKSSGIIDDLLSYGFTTLTWFVLSVFFTILFRIPVDCYIVSKSKENYRQSEQCVIKYFVDGRKSDYIAYSLNKRTERIYTDYKTIKQLEESKAKEKYIVIYFRESIWNTQVIEDFDLIADEN